MPSAKRCRKQSSIFPRPRPPTCLDEVQRYGKFCPVELGDVPTTSSVNFPIFKPFFISSGHDSPFAGYYQHDPNVYAGAKIGHAGGPHQQGSIPRAERRSNRSVGAPLLALFEKGPPDSRHHWTPR